MAKQPTHKPEAHEDDKRTVSDDKPKPGDRLVNHPATGNYDPKRDDAVVTEEGEKQPVDGDPTRDVDADGKEGAVRQRPDDQD